MPFYAQCDKAHIQLEQIGGHKAGRDANGHVVGGSLFNIFFSKFDIYPLFYWSCCDLGIYIVIENGRASKLTQESLWTVED